MSATQGVQLAEDVAAAQAIKAAEEMATAKGVEGTDLWKKNEKYIHIITWLCIMSLGT